MRRQLERTEQAEIVKLLRTLGASVYVLGTTRKRGDFMGTMQTPGIPDLYAVMPPKQPMVFRHAVWIEVKAANGKLSEAQRQFQRDALLTIGIGYVTGGCDAVIQWLQENGWLKHGPQGQGREPR